MIEAGITENPYVDAANIIPSSMIMEGTLRIFSEPLRAFLMERIGTISVSIAEAFRGKAVVSVPYSACALTAEDGCGYSLHNPKIRFREEALIYGAAAYAAGAEMWLKKQGEKTSM